MGGKRVSAVPEPRFAVLKLPKLRRCNVLQNSIDRYEPSNSRCEAMTPAEFEEKSYEAPLYNQLERGQRDVFTPGQVLESPLGFDRGLFLTQAALWETLGFDSPLRGAALAYYHWPPRWGPPDPRKQLPRFRLNLFLQAKRPVYYKRKPRALGTISTISAPLWAFRITEHQQRL